MIFPSTTPREAIDVLCTHSSGARTKPQIGRGKTQQEKPPITGTAHKLWWTQWAQTYPAFL